MTKEIWAAVIIAITQIIVTVSVAWWQIRSAKAAVNPEEKPTKPKTSRSDKIWRYFSKYPLHILIPLLINIAIILSLLSKNQSKLVILIWTIWTFLSLLHQLLVHFFFYSLFRLSELLGKTIEIHKHTLKRLECHESILFDLTDKPCKDDGICKFEVSPCKSSEQMPLFSSSVSQIKENK